MASASLPSPTQPLQCHWVMVACTKVLHTKYTIYTPLQLHQLCFHLNDIIKVTGGSNPKVTSNYSRVIFAEGYIESPMSYMIQTVFKAKQKNKGTSNKTPRNEVINKLRKIKSNKNKYKQKRKLFLINSLTHNRENRDNRYANEDKMRCVLSRDSQ